MEEPKSQYKKNSISFNDYFLKVGGKSTVVDFENKIIIIKDHENNTVSKLMLSKSINCEFQLKELTKKEHIVGDFLYFVFENGYNKHNWLWRSEIALQL